MTLKNHNRFNFVRDLELKNELEISYSFISVLLELSEKHLEDSLNANNNLFLCYKKTILIYLGAIIEGILVYTAKELKLNDKGLYDTKVTHLKDICDFEDGKLAVYKTKREYINPDNIIFHKLIKAFETGISSIPNNIVDALHNIRKMRNGIHMHEFLLTNQNFINTELTIFFKNAKEIISFCENILK